MIDVVYPFLCHKNDFFGGLNILFSSAYMSWVQKKSFPLGSLTERKVRSSK